MPKLSINFEEIISHAPGNFEEQNKVLEPSIIIINFFFPLCRSGPNRAMASSVVRFLDHTQRRTTVGRTPLDA